MSSRRRLQGFLVRERERDDSASPRRPRLHASRLGSAGRSLSSPFGQSDSYASWIGTKPHMSIVQRLAPQISGYIGHGALWAEPTGQAAEDPSKAHAPETASMLTSRAGQGSCRRCLTDEAIGLKAHTFVNLPDKGPGPSSIATTSSSPTTRRRRATWRWRTAAPSRNCGGRLRAMIEGRERTQRISAGRWSRLDRRFVRQRVTGRRDRLVADARPRPASDRRWPDHPSAHRGRCGVPVPGKRKGLCG